MKNSILGKARLHCRLSLTFALFLLSTPLQAQETLDPNVIQYKLDNGLTVVLAPSKTAQTVSLVTVYHVGSANESPGRSGFAHLFEHLMFEGTKSTPDFEKSLSSLGGDSNAFTQDDTTTYYMTGPKEALPQFLRLDADRMANLANSITDKNLTNQRDVVLNEMRQNTLDQPGGAAQAQTASSIYPAEHPYAHATIGSIADLGAATLEDVASFHRTFYVPANAYVAVTGNFDIEVARELVTQTFGLVPRAEVTPVPVPQPTKPKAQKLNFVDAVATPVVTFNWPTGPDGTRQSLINGMAAAALTAGKDSFDDQLVIQDGIASGAGAYSVNRDLGGVFGLYATAAQGIAAGKLETALRETFAQIKDEGFPDEALKVVRAGLESAYASTPSNPVGFGIALANSAIDGDARDWRRELGWSKTVTLDELNTALRSFNVEEALVATVVPGPRNTNYPPVIANSTGKSESRKFDPRPEIVFPEFQVAEASALKLPAFETRKLASGASLIAYKVEDNAQIGISLVVKGGDVDAPIGLSELGMSVTGRGAGELSLPELDARYRANGISLYGSSGWYYSQIMASAPRDKLSELAAQLADVIMRPRFDTAEWTAQLKTTAVQLEQSRNDPDYLASRKLLSIVYPVTALEARDLEAAALAQLKSDDAKTVFLTRMRPDAATFHIASNLSIDEVAATLDKAFAGWSASGSANPLDGGTRPLVKDGRTDIQVDGAAQATIRAALPAPNEGTREKAAFDIAVDVLGEGLQSRLNTVLREEKGWSYGVSAETSGDKGKDNSLLYVSASVETVHTEESIVEMRRIIADLAKKPVTVEEFLAVKSQIRARYLSSFNSAPQTAMTAGYFMQNGYSISEAQQTLDQFNDVTLEEVNKQAAIIAQSPITLVVAGDKAKM